MKNQRIEEILQEALKSIYDLKDDSSIQQFMDIRNKYLAKKSELGSIMSTLGGLQPDERKALGQEINIVKKKISDALQNKQIAIEEYQLNKKLESEQIDISLPGKDFFIGSTDPFYLVKKEITDIFLNMGYEVVEGPEVESDHNNFELLNIPKDHPARDMQDTFWINDNTLMRSHTSAVQARVMQERKGQPLKIICPGKTYRRDDDDATHSHQFAQIEGLLIDKNINLGHLKATLKLFLKRLFGEEREIRLRSSYFPFTEPSVEVDISCANCHGKGCSMCKGTGYIEILGAGMVHPNVLKMNDYDPNIYSGFAFGLGIERIAILKYGIDDIRRIYTNDVKFLHQFKKKY